MTGSPAAKAPARAAAAPKRAVHQPPPPPSSDPFGGDGFRVGDAIAYGWHATLKNVAPMIVIAIVILLTQGVLQVIGRGFHNLVLATAWSVLVLIVGLILAMGLIRAALRITDGGRPDVNQLTQTDLLVGRLLFSQERFGCTPDLIEW